jgi:hypothetical protein
MQLVIQKFIQSITQHTLVINIKIENYGDMFRFTEPSSGQIQNTVLIHSVAVIFSFNIDYQYMLCY